MGLIISVYWYIMSWCADLWFRGARAGHRGHGPDAVSRCFVTAAFRWLPPPTVYHHAEGAAPIMDSALIMTMGSAD